MRSRGTRVTEGSEGSAAAVASFGVVVASWTVSTRLERPPKRSAASARLYTATSGAVTILGPELDLAWAVGEAKAGQQHAKGDVALDGAWSETGMEASGSVDFGELAQVEGTFAMETRDGAPYVDLTVPQASLRDPLWSAVATEHLPIALHFDALSLSDVRIGVHARADGPRVEAAELKKAEANTAIRDTWLLRDFLVEEEGYDPADVEKRLEMDINFMNETPFQ